MCREQSMKFPFPKELHINWTLCGFVKANILSKKAFVTWSEFPIFPLLNCRLDMDIYRHHRTVWRIRPVPVPTMRLVDTWTHFTTMQTVSIHKKMCLLQLCYDLSCFFCMVGWNEQKNDQENVKETFFLFHYPRSGWVLKWPFRTAKKYLFIFWHVKTGHEKWAASYYMYFIYEKREMK